METIAPLERPAAAPPAEHLRAYLASRLGGQVTVLRVTALGQPGGDVKAYGYGVPLRIDYERNGRRESAVLETVAPGGFGHQHMADRAQTHLWSHTAFNALPRHVRSLDVGGVRLNGTLTSVADIEEFFTLTEFVDGDGYNRDLERLRTGGEMTEQDLARLDALCDYLVEIHATRGTDASLYTRRVRELVGHNECIMGILDAYPDRVDGVTAADLKAIEHACIDWRWRLKGATHRLRQVHGDFHPWNILFQEGTRFVVLDRSRGEWGEPADDVACLTMNYLFFSLLRSATLDLDFLTLFYRFWLRYLDATQDAEMCRVAAPFLAFRALVMANPIWYPHLPATVRPRLIAFVNAVLASETFDPTEITRYLR